ncbi:DUF3783 domain-containing protein [Desulfatirhabdium butyrativorans]|uniref:DUF3783 domain-containing protein n=1 Tax=Desulfatirhabdium butyrativorans TaxID=340467 RepID=UPI0003FAEFF0|nr:DUF3783 domain-containing protein [Desulfatirhabdium butyrativorans]
MAEARFEKLNPSDTALYGPRKLLLCGFGREAQPKFQSVVEMAGLADVPLVWAGADDATAKVGELFKRDGGYGAGIGSALNRAVIAAGITENELLTLMHVCKKSGMQTALWATLTPTSETWTLRALLGELSAERRQLERKRR